jgi:hypothetical protein
VVFVPIHTFFIQIIVRIHTRFVCFYFFSKSAQAARGEARAHLLPRPGRTRLPRPLGYTQLPRPVRVRSWGGWVRNGIKVQFVLPAAPTVRYVFIERSFDLLSAQRPANIFGRRWALSKSILTRVPTDIKLFMSVTK